jgi:mannose-6-phosphate isomerase-like protein (cupin superfamily)
VDWTKGPCGARPWKSRCARSGDTVNSPIEIETLPGDDEAHRFVGAEHGDVPVSMFLVHSLPGAGPKLHKHPNPEVFVIQAGQATFEVDGIEIVAEPGQIVVAPAHTPHRFTNTGTDRLRLTAIHPTNEIQTNWLE